jgi:hypothetical protein
LHAVHSKIRISLFARPHDLRVERRQRLGGLLSLWRSDNNRLDTINGDPNAHLRAVGNKASLRACRSDLGAWVPGHRLSGLCQRKAEHSSKKKTNQAQRYVVARMMPLTPYTSNLADQSHISGVHAASCRQFIKCNEPAELPASPPPVSEIAVARIAEHHQAAAKVVLSVAPSFSKTFSTKNLPGLVAPLT